MDDYNINYLIIISYNFYILKYIIWILCSIINYIINLITVINFIVV